MKIDEQTKIAIERENKIILKEMSLQKPPIFVENFDFFVASSFCGQNKFL
jgi:hypothetical protein